MQKEARQNERMNEGEKEQPRRRMNGMCMQKYNRKTKSFLLAMKL